VSQRWADLPISAKGFAVLATPLLMLVLAAVLFFANSVVEQSSQNWVTHTMDVRSTVERVTGDILDGETGIRGYLASGDTVFLVPMRTGRAAITGDLNSLASLVRDNPLETSRVATLRKLLQGGFQFSLTNIPSAQNATARREWLLNQKSSTDQIRVVLRGMLSTEKSLLLAREARSNHDRWVGRLLVGGALCLGLLAGIVAMMVFTRDITRRLRRLLGEANRLHDETELGAIDPSADELGALSQHLHEVVASQRALKEQALDARRQAETASEEKSRFLSRMSHELRTPLNAVLGFAQLLEMDADPGQLGSLAQIRGAGRHLLDLINEVLDISRIESGTMTLSSEPVSVAEMVAEIIELLSPMAADRQVHLSSSGYQPCPYYVQADRQRLKQIMLNLISNAIKYNRPGGSVRFECELVEDRVRVDIVDTGIGIADSDLERLFTPFERFGAAESDIEGSGIGLVLSQHLAHAMGGVLTASSRHGEGSVFSLILPLADVPAMAARAEMSVPVRIEIGDPRASATLLYIEDNASNVRLLEGILLRRPSWSLSHAGHGRLGMELATSRPFDLILLDLHLPDISGAEVLRNLRANPGTAKVPIVVLSADASPGQIDRLIAAGADSYVTKPIDVEDLLNLLDATTASLPRDSD
jgi:signal transduction histidine kinase/ActR/RegA family two-component response regulator